MTRLARLGSGLRSSNSSRHWRGRHGKGFRKTLTRSCAVGANPASLVWSHLYYRVHDTTELRKSDALRERMEVGRHLGVPTRRAVLSGRCRPGASHCRTSSLRRIHDRVQHAVHVDDVFKIGHSCNILMRAVEAALLRTSPSTFKYGELNVVLYSYKYCTSRILLRHAPGRA